MPLLSKGIQYRKLKAIYYLELRLTERAAVIPLTKTFIALLVKFLAKYYPTLIKNLKKDKEELSAIL